MNYILNLSPKKYAHGLRFVVFCCGEVSTN